MGEARDEGEAYCFRQSTALSNCGLHTLHLVLEDLMCKTVIA